MLRYGSSTSSAPTQHERRQERLPKMQSINFDIDGDGIATLTIDVPGQSMNVIGPDFMADLDAAITRIASEEAIRGAVIASGKASGFVAGMDMTYFGSMLGGAGSQGERGVGKEWVGRVRCRG